MENFLVELYGLHNATSIQTHIKVELQKVSQPV